MNFNKRVNGSWVDTPNYIHNTSTDTITTLPADLYPNDTTATVGISGNTVQSGTPTPDIPVDVAGCGAKTANLFDIDNVLEDYYLRNGVPTEYHIGRYVLSDYIPIASDTATISAKITISSYFGAHWAVYDENKTFIRGGIAFDTNGSGIKARDVDTSGAAFIRVDYSTQSLTDCMLNLGSTPLPYEPYGYKIPISSANTTTPIYLGEVETTRQIKKIVFVGSEDENWSGQPAGGGAIRFRYTISNSVQADTAYLTSICTHLTLGVEGGTWNTDNIYTISNNYLWVRLDSSFTTAVSLKSWLAQQYANGTPFTVYYTLATPETAVVNEPLRKIGDYADEISGITIPTITGKDTFDVLTTLKPSEVSLTYTGWHDAEVKEWDGSEWEGE